MSDSECEISQNTPDLDYDMWEGQFEFVGPEDRIIAQEYAKPPPHLHPTVNGAKKNAAHAWCEEVSDKVIILL